MATNYPTEKDVWQNKIASGAIYAQDFVNLQDACAALETKVGVDGSSVDSTLDYKARSIIAASVYIYFYENSAPTGWTATLIPGDYVLGLAASSGHYAKGGQTASGTWDLTEEAKADSHNHIWMYFSANYNYSYNSAANASIFTGVGGTLTAKGALKTFVVNTHRDSTSQDAESRLFNQTAYTSNTAHTHTFTAGWRPAAAVGVVAYYTGPT